MKTRLLAVLTGFVALAIHLPTSADEAANCKAPAWAPQPPPGYHIDSCETHAWGENELDLADGQKTVSGRSTEVTYELAEGAKDHAAAEVRKFYVDAATKAGATLKSNADDGYNATLFRKTTNGDQWLMYAHGSGNEESTGSFTLTTLDTGALQLEVVAQPMTRPMESSGKTCAPPPWLKKQFDYFKLDGCSYRDVDQIELDLPEGTKILAGRYLSVNYTLTDPARDPTAVFVQKNFVGALQAIGAKLVSNPDDAYNAVLTQKTPVGDLWYVYKHGSGNENSTTSYDLLTVEVGGPAPKSCTLEVYGVNFDFNKSVLRADSDPVLQQVLALFTGDPSFGAEVSGHTDNVGKPDYNLKLSHERADAVKAWLVAHGVAGTRITTNGYGDTRPLVPNTTDENRFRNRRVELKRNNCRG